MAGYGKSDIGKIREINQDAILVENAPVGTFPNLYIVADGMGGSLAGEIASQMAVNGVKAFLQKNPMEDYCESLKAAAADANTLVFDNAKDDKLRSGMGTTLLAMIADGEFIRIINIGDSRLYVVNTATESIKQITVDHSYVMELVLSGKITLDEAEHHPNKNIITRALGTSPEVECDKFSYQLVEHDVILLCSDGLTNMVSSEKIVAIIKESKQKEDAVERLIAEANNNGGMDNISVILYSQVDGV